MFTKKIAKINTFTDGRLLHMTYILCDSIPWLKEATDFSVITGTNILILYRAVDLSDLSVLYKKIKIQKCHF